MKKPDITFKALKKLAAQKEASEKHFKGCQADIEAMQELWAEALKDPETLKAMEQMGEKFGSAMENLAKMTPEELQKQMEDAMEIMFTSESMVDAIVERDEVLAELERSGMATHKALARFKANPIYIKLKIREPFDEMKNTFNDPDYKATLEAMMVATRDAVLSKHLEDPKWNLGCGSLVGLFVWWLLR